MNFLSRKSLLNTIDIRNVDVSNANFITTFNVTSNINIETVATAPRYLLKEGVSYYFPNEGAVASFGFSVWEESFRPTSVKFNGTTFDLSSYVYRNSSIPVWVWVGEEPDAYKDSTDSFYYYHVTIGGKSVEIIASFDQDGELIHLGLHFSLNGSTNVEFVF